MINRVLFASLLLLSLATPALALGTSAERAACTPDVFRLCASQIPDVDAIIACLKHDKPQLSAACRTVMDNEEKKTSTATRSMQLQPQWCRFDAETAADADWRTWCGAQATTTP